MLSVEDALETLADLAQDSLYSFTGKPAAGRFNKWDQEFILDMDCHVKEHRAISTAQSAIVLKLIKQHRGLLERKGIPAAAIDALLLSPVFRVAPYQSTVLPREVRWAGKNLLAFRCKFNTAVVEDIKRLRWSNPIASGTGSPVFLHSVKLWIVNVTDDNVENVMSVIQRHKFGFDSAVEELFLRVVNSRPTRGSIELENNQLVLNISNDTFMNAWALGALRLDGYNV